MSFFPLHPAFPDPERDAFADILLSYLRHRGEARELEYKPEYFTLRLGSDEVALDGRYQRFLAADAQTHDAMMDQLYSGMQPAQTYSLQQALPLLRPVLRSRARQENLRLSSVVAGLDVDHEALQAWVGDLAWGLLLDVPNGYQSVRQSQVSGWGLSMPELLKRALTNLPALSVNTLSPGLYSLTSSGGLASGHLLNKGLRLPGRPVVIAPNRDLVLIANADVPQALSALFKQAEEAMGNEFALSMQTLTLKGTSDWRPLALSESMDIYPIWRSQQLRGMAALYNEQRHWLMQSQALAGKETVYIPELVAARAADGSLINYTVVTEEVTLPHWLPKADTVVFMGKGEDASPLPLAWNLIVNKGLLKQVDVDLALPRYVLEGYPASNFAE